MGGSTRRQLMAAVPAVAVAAVVPASLTKAHDRFEWDRAMREYQDAKSADEAFSARYWTLWQQCRAECDNVPHVSLRPDIYSGRVSPVSTADDAVMREARRDIDALDAGRMRYDPGLGWEEHFQLQRDLVAAADQRDATVRAIRERYNMDALDDESDLMSDRVTAADKALMAMPAPDLAALRWKLELLREDPEKEMPGWSADYLRQTFLDVKALMPA